MKLTSRQLEALEKLTREDDPINAYRLRVGLNTLNSLALKKLVTASYELGCTSMPHTAIKWRITTAGRVEVEKALSTA